MNVLKIIRCAFLSLFYLSAQAHLVSKELNQMPSTDNPNYTYDSNQVRYELYQTNGEESYNWLFFPGGPGGDSSYFRSLADLVDLPGNVWLIDLPGNGSNVTSDTSEDFDAWLEIFPSLIKKFKNPIVVGHSFGGMLPLLFPELESQLKGLVILNSTPSLWMEEAAAYGQQFDLPDLTAEMGAFVENPCQETFDMALEACTPYYFPEANLTQGKELLSKLPFQYLPAVWWQKKALETNYSAKWAPEQIPTLIIGGKYDCICPFSLFEKDKRFDRENIELIFIEDAGHLPWLENPQAVSEALTNFNSRLLSKDEDIKP